MIQFQANLSEKSLNDLIKDLTNYGEKMQLSQADILDALATYVREKIIHYIDEDNLIRTGRLRSSFIKEVSENIARVYTDVEYAKYVEFGTGVRGENSAYDTKYIADKALEYSPDIQGQVAHKFIYHAVQDLENDYVDIVKNVLKEKGLI